MTHSIRDTERRLPHRNKRRHITPYYKRMKELTTIKQFPLTPSLKQRVLAVPAPVDISYAQAIAICADIIGNTDAREVKVNQGRSKMESIEEYLKEIPSDAIVRVAEAAMLAVQGERWANIQGGHGFGLLTWLRGRYPVTEVLWGKIEQLRGEARAQKALDKLDAIAEEAEQDGAKVKAIELTLRAHHPAFGAKTAQKQTSDRPVVVVNIAQIFGKEDEKASKSVIDAE